MKGTSKNLLNAARLIQDYCSGENQCTDGDNCIFYDKTTGRCAIQCTPVHWDIAKLQEQLETPHKVFNVEEVVDKVLDYFGYNRLGQKVHDVQGEKLYPVPNIISTEARQVQKKINKLLHYVDGYCEMTYVKKDCTAYFDIYAAKILDLGRHNIR